MRFAYALTPLFVVLSKLIRRRDYIAFLSYPDVADSSWALYRFALDRNLLGAKVVWLVKDVDVAKSRLSSIRNFSASKTRVLKKNSVRGLIYFISSGVVFFTHGHFSFSKPIKSQTLVNLWHGMPLKRIGYLDTSGHRASRRIVRCDFVIATSRFFQGIMAEAFGLPMQQCLVTGLPRNDPLVKQRLAKSGASLVRQVLWMPTYRRSTEGDVRIDGNVTEQLSPGKLLEIDEFLSTRDVYLTVKIHPMDVLNEVLFPTMSKVRVINRNSEYFDTSEELAKADALITDYSSAFIDYLIMGRPIGFIVNDRDSYWRGFVPEVEKELGFPGSILGSQEDVLRFIAGEIGESPPVEIQSLAHDQLDALASEAVFDVLGGRIEREMCSSEIWPLVELWANIHKNKC